MIMILFGSLSAGTKHIYYIGQTDMLLCLHFAIPYQVGCLKFCFSLEIRSSIWPFTISFQDDRTESSTISHLAQCNAYWSAASYKSMIPVMVWLSVFRAFCNQNSQLGIWNDSKFTSDYMAIWLI